MVCMYLRTYLHPRWMQLFNATEQSLSFSVQCTDTRTHTHTHIELTLPLIVRRQDVECDTWLICLDIRASAIRLRPGRGRPDSVRAGRHLFRCRRNSASDQQGRSQLVAGSLLGYDAHRRRRTHPVSGAAGVACCVRCCWTCEKRTIGSVVSFLLVSCKQFGIVDMPNETWWSDWLRIVILTLILGKAGHTQLLSV